MGEGSVNKEVIHLFYHNFTAQVVRKLIFKSMDQFVLVHLLILNSK